MKHKVAVVAPTLLRTSWLAPSMTTRRRRTSTTRRGRVGAVILNKREHNIVV
jgi:hypothetical protein